MSDKINEDNKNVEDTNDLLETKNIGACMIGCLILRSCVSLVVISYF